MVINGAVAMDYTSERPYKLAQRCDGTIDDCVHGLFILWARSQGLNAKSLYTEAYPKEAKDSYDEEEILRIARLEGIEEPDVWGEKELNGLLESLEHINNHSLYGVIVEKYSLGE